MGGSSKKQKIGNKYFLGFSLVPCREHDALLEIELNDKTAWQGQTNSGRLSVRRNNLFGGDEREGGFVGDIDVQDGNTEQAVNTYLSGAKNTLTSAMRGCVSLVFRRPYISANTARLPKLRTKHANIKSISRGWNEADALVKTTAPRSGDMLFFNFENTTTSDAPGRVAAQDGIAAFLRSLKGSTNSVHVQSLKKVLAPGPVSQLSHMTRYDCTDQDYEDLAVFVETSNTAGDVGGSNNLDLSLAEDFFSRGIPSGAGVFFSGSLLGGDTEGGEIAASDGQKHIFLLNAVHDAEDALSAAPVIASIGDVLVSVLEFKTVGGSYLEPGLSSLDTTDITGVQRPLTASQTTTIIQNSIGDWFDMNPAHILRCLWTDPTRGGPVSESDIGDSFDAAADLYLDEKLGLSLKFRGIDQADADRLEVERHIDAVTFRSNKTGKIEIANIRDDYVVGDLQVLDSSIVTDWSGLSRPRKSEIPNQLTVKYTRRDGKIGSVTRTNVAGVRRAGRVIKAQDVSYLGCTSLSLATRLCLRDLSVVTTDLLTGELPLAYLPADIEPGTAVVLNEPLVGINNLVVRVSETRLGAHDDSAARITVSEDKYATTQAVEIPEPDVSDIRAAKPVLHRLVTEASYYQGVLAIGQTSVDDELADEPDLGRLLATGVQADGDQLEATLATGVSDVWTDQGLVDFEPYGVLVNDLSGAADVTTFLVTENDTLDEIFEGDLARIGAEIIRIDDLTDQGDGTVLVTCGRGCLDGPPAAHTAGTAFVLSSVVPPLELDFIAGQSVDVKMLSRTGDAALALIEAETDSVTFSSRAIRPYPPGKLQIGGAYDLNDVAQSGTITATWTHRDRLLQTTPAVDDFTAASIGPESGTTYNMHVEGFDPDGVSVGDMVDTNIGSVVTYDLDLSTGVPAGSFELVMTVSSLRDGYTSWQSPSMTIPLNNPGYGNGYGYRYGQ